MRRGAFTLVELLVVIGIVALLAGILLPALNRARAMARGVACLSNLRQMAVAANGYVTENKGHYPAAYFSVTDGVTLYRYNWDFTTVDGPAGVRIVPGLLWRASDPTRIQQCPAFEGESNTAADPFTGYNYNTSFVGHGPYESHLDNQLPPVKASAVRRASTVAMFGDGQWAGGANKYMRAPFPNPGDDYVNSGRSAGTQGYRHLRKTNVAYCDGHAEAVGDRFTDNQDGAANVADGCGFLSKDNAAYATQ